MSGTTEYGWYIYESFVENDCRDSNADKRKAKTISVFGPSGISDENKKSLKDGKGAEFELYDDDEILYYKGRLIGDFCGFEPLDDYGLPSAGAVHVKIDGEWL